MADTLETDKMTLRAWMTIGRGLGLTGAISACLLGGAFAFEYIGGLMPCSMCIWQRWPHAIIIVAALIGLRGIAPTVMMGIIAISAAVSIGLGSFHAGVEWQLWQGPSGCTAALQSNMAAADLVDQLLATPIVRCDEVAWSFLGISMAGWNAIFSLDMFLIALFAMLGRNSIKNDS
ncbi:MAG: disulfide bond formation protein B [Candidatus Puniceispirillum sp.]